MSSKEYEIESEERESYDNDSSVKADHDRISVVISYLNDLWSNESERNESRQEYKAHYTSDNYVASMLG